MSYFFTKKTNYKFDEAINLITESLQEEGFNIVSQIDMQKTLKEKINRNFKRYHILGACNPTLANEALLAEDKIGLLLPCNITVIEQDENTVEVSIFNPINLLDIVKNDRLECFTTDARGKLRRALSRI